MAHGFMRPLTSIPANAAAAALESLLVTKYFPQYLPADQNGFSRVFIRIAAVHAVWIALYFFVYWGLIYPYFVSPLRHFPQPRVSTSPLARLPNAM